MVFAGLDVGTTKRLVSDGAAQGYHPSLLMLVHSLDPQLTEIPDVSVIAVEPTSRCACSDRAAFDSPALGPGQRRGRRTVTRQGRIERWQGRSVARWPGHQVKKA